MKKFAIDQGARKKTNGKAGRQAPATIVLKSSEAKKMSAKTKQAFAELARCVIAPNAPDKRRGEET